MMSHVYSNMCYCIDLNNINHLFNPRIEFLNEDKICIKCTNSVKLEVTCLRCLKGFPFVLIVAEKGFSQVAGWLTVQWSFVVTSWALADEWSESVAS